MMFVLEQQPSFICFHLTKGAYLGDYFQYKRCCSDAVDDIFRLWVTSYRCRLNVPSCVCGCMFDMVTGHFRIPLLTRLGQSWAPKLDLRPLKDSASCQFWVEIR